MTVTAPEIVSINILETDQIIYTTETLNYTAIATFTDSSTADITATATWSSSNTSAATISNSAGSEGHATGISEGTTTITAAVGAVSGSTGLTVEIMPPSMQISDVSANECSGCLSMNFTVTLSGSSTKTITVDYYTSDNEATAGSDYTEILTKTLTFNPGETAKTITVAILEDNIEEDDETFNVNLANGTNVTISDPVGVGTIFDDDKSGLPLTTKDVTLFTTGGGPTFNMIYLEGGLQYRTGLDDNGTVDIERYLHWLGWVPTIYTDPIVTMNDPILIAQTETTYELWYAVRTWATTDAGGGKRADSGPLYTFANPGKEGTGGIDGAPPTAAKNQPVTHLNWRDTLVWCNAMTEYYNYFEGKTLACVYEYNNEIIRNSTNGIACDNAVQLPCAKGFRLPTTTEWGAAARYQGSDNTTDVQGNDGGNPYEYPVGSGYFWTAGDNKYSDNHRWDYSNSPLVTHEVATKLPNILGLYDMAGNVRESMFNRWPSNGNYITRGGDVKAITFKDNLERGRWQIWLNTTGTLMETMGFRLFKSAIVAEPTAFTRLSGVSGVNTYANGIDIDSIGNSYVTGHTAGNLDGQIKSGTYDVFVIKYDPSGNKLWTRLSGVSGEYTYGKRISVDSSGNSYVVGNTTGNLDGQTLAGTGDTFVIKYDTSGNKQWTRLSGVSGEYTAGWGIDVDSSGNIYVGGLTDGNLDGQTITGTRDKFVMKYDLSGNKQWTMLLGSPGVSTETWDMKVHNSGRTYVVGDANGNLDGETKTGAKDAFITTKLYQ